MKTFYRTIARDPPCRNIRKINAKFLPRPISKRSVRKVGGISFYHSPLCRRADVAIPSRFIYRPIILSRSSRFFTSPHFSDKALGFFSKDSFSLLLRKTEKSRAYRIDLLRPFPIPQFFNVKLSKYGFTYCKEEKETLIFCALSTSTSKCFCRSSKSTKIFSSETKEKKREEKSKTPYKRRFDLSQTRRMDGEEGGSSSLAGSVAHGITGHDPSRYIGIICNEAASGGFSIRFH